MNLNPEQTQAVETLDGPVLVVAGAGSGKTRVLTQRYLNLIQKKNLTPDNILCVTFTNKAANEMKGRIRAAGVNISPDPRESWVSTFHSFGRKVLRQYGHRIHAKGNWEIVRQSDSENVIKRILLENGFSEITKPKSALNHISRAKDECLSPEQYESEVEKYVSFPPLAEILPEIYRKYQKYLESNKCYDFGDLLMKTIQLLEQHPDALEALQDQLQYIQIDEYQDTNLAQHLLISTLGQKYKNVCVVGDPDQTIYTWRGARMDNLKDFESDFGKPKVIVMDRNYRSTENILLFSNMVISHNVDREEKNLRTEISSPIKVQIVPCWNEAPYVITCIQDMVSENEAEYGDFAILYRANHQSAALEGELIANSIPFEKKGIGFFNRKEIQDITAYLYILADPSNDIKLLRILNTPKRGIGTSSQNALESWSTQNSVPLIEALRKADEISGVSSQACSGVQRLLTALDKIRQDYPDLSQPSIFCEALDKLAVDIGFFNHLTEEDAKYQDQYESHNQSSRYDNVKEFLKIAGSSQSLEHFLETIALNAEAEEAREYESSANSNKVQLSTVHSAKGLEFPIVFIIGMNQGSFPITRMDEVEEERRLAYVAFTRAQNRLLITYSGSSPPSQFLIEAYLALDNEGEIVHWENSESEMQKGLNYQAFG